MKNFLSKFEHSILVALIVMMVIVVFLATVELGWIFVKDITTPHNGGI